MARLRLAALLAGHALLFGLCLELAARVDDWLSYGAPLVGAYDAEALQLTDAQGLHRNVPGARFEKWRINALGFRGPERARAKPAGTRRVVCLGQSETFGLHESEGGEWPARLERLLQARHPRVEVLNASTVGPGRWGRLAYLEQYVLPLQPDVVVIYPSVLLDAFTPGPPVPAPASAASWLPSSRVLPKVGQRLRQVVPESLAAPLRLWLVERRVERLEAAALAAGGRRIDDLPEAEARGFEAHLREVVELLQSHGVVPVLATYPTLGAEGQLEQHRLLVAHQRAWNPILSAPGLVRVAARLNAVIRGLAAERGLALADAAAAVPLDEAHFADYVHYTDAGAERVAECVAGALEGAGLLEGGPP